MKKRIILGVTILFLLFTGFAFAANDTTPNAVPPTTPNGWTFEEMLPFMKAKHPGLDEEVLQKIYESHHSTSPVMGPYGHGKMMGHCRYGGSDWNK